MWIAVIAALAAGASFAFAGLLQQHAASLKPSDESLSPKLLLSLAQEPVWLGGIALAVLSYAFQALALSFGPLTLVQPLIVSELIFALPVSARLHGLRLGRREWLAAAAVAIGLVVAVVSASPKEGDPMAPVGEWLVVLVGVGALVAFALLVGRRLGSTWRASSYALAGAATLGTQSAVFDATIALLRHDGFGMLANWQPYALIVLSIGGLLLVQSAYQAGPLAASLPVINGFEPAVAVVLGMTLFHEPISTGPLRYLGMGAGIVSVVTGIVLLDTSEVVKRVHEKEDEEAEREAEPQDAEATGS